MGIYRLGGTARVAALIGGERICSLGRLVFSLSADLVSRRRRLGVLGFRGGGGRLKESWEGGGDGEESAIISEDDIAEGIMGRGECVLVRAESPSCSISGSVFDRAAADVSSWNKPPVDVFLVGSRGGILRRSSESGSSDTIKLCSFGCDLAAANPPCRKSIVLPWCNKGVISGMRAQAAVPPLSLSFSFISSS